MRINRYVFELVLGREGCFQYWWSKTWFLALSPDVMLVWCFLGVGRVIVDLVAQGLVYCLMVSVNLFDGYLCNPSFGEWYTGFRDRHFLESPAQH